MSRRRAICRLLAVFAVLAASGAGADDSAPAPATPGHSLAGQLLVAKERMADPRFKRTVIYMVEHNSRGAMGLVVNRVMGRGPMDKFLKGFGIDSQTDLGAISLHYGGPVERSRGLILHTTDYQDATTRLVPDGFAMTMELGVLRALGSGKGPRRAMFALGYAGWGPGQLEDEMARDDWELAPADEDLVFDDNDDTKWDRAMAKVKVRL